MRPRLDHNGLALPSIGAELDDDAPLCAVHTPASLKCASKARAASVEPPDVDAVGSAVLVGRCGRSAGCGGGGGGTPNELVFDFGVRGMSSFWFAFAVGTCAAGPNDTGFEVGVGKFKFF